MISLSVWTARVTTIAMGGELARHMTVLVVVHFVIARKTIWVRLIALKVRKNVIRTPCSNDVSNDLILCFSGL